MGLRLGASNGVPAGSRELDPCEGEDVLLSGRTETVTHVLQLGSYRLEAIPEHRQRAPNSRAVKGLYI
jgi:hypothetical protein